MQPRALPERLHLGCAHSPGRGPGAKWGGVVGALALDHFFNHFPFRQQRGAAGGDGGGDVGGVVAELVEDRRGDVGRGDRARPGLRAGGGGGADHMAALGCVRVRLRELTLSGSLTLSGLRP